MTGLLPFIEKWFGVLTDISLLELGDISASAVARAGPPGAGHLQPFDQRRRDRRGGGRSDRRQRLAGARRGLFPRHRQDAQAAVLRRKPGTKPPSRHETLLPAMSTLIIIAHVKDGADLARQHHLPAADHRLHRAASRHDAGRVFLPPRRKAKRPPIQTRVRSKSILPLSGPQTANQGGRRADAGRRRRKAPAARWSIPPRPGSKASFAISP